MTLSDCEHASQKLATLTYGTDPEIAHAVIAHLESEHCSRILYCDNNFHTYCGRNWRILSEHGIRNLIYSYDRQTSTSKKLITLTRTRCDSILSIMRDRVRDPDFFANSPIGINCSNGFITFDESGAPQITPHSPEHRQRFCLTGTWDPSVNWRDAELLGRLLDGCFGIDEDCSEKIALIGELCGMAALGDSTILANPKAFVLCGASAANGKSEMLAMVSGLLPEDAVCAIPPTLFGDKSMLVQLIGCSLNACAELGSSQAVASDVFKSVVTGDSITARNLYSSAVTFRSTAVQLFATNALPEFRGGLDRGVQRRLIVIPFNRTIPPDERIARIGKRIAEEEPDALLCFAVEGASRALSNGQFTEPSSTREALRDWIFNSDVVLAWKESCTEFSETAKTVKKHAYQDFTAWAEANGIPQRHIPPSNIFTARLLSLDSRLSSSRTSKERFFVGLQLKTSAEYSGAEEC